MRWLYHVLPRSQASLSKGSYAPASLAEEGFVHASYQPLAEESARLYVEDDPVALRIDPRRLPVPVVEADTPRGPMPHIHGPVARDAIAGVVEIQALADAPDRVRGTRIGFVAFEGMTLLDLVGALDPLSRIRSMGFDDSSSCEVIAGTLGSAVWEGHGAKLRVQRVRPSLAEFDLVVLPGGAGTRQLVKDTAFVRWLGTFPSNRLATSVCTGSLLWGAAGRLRGKRATTHASAMGDLAGHGAQAVRARVVDEGQLVTAAGVSAAIDLGLHLALRLEGPEVARRIAEQMELPEGFLALSRP